MTVDALFEKATDAVERRNYDYAIELLFQLLQMDPTNVKARQTLWLAEKRKFDEGDSGKSKGLFGGLGSRLSAGVSALMGKPLKIIEACERALMSDPYDANIRCKLAQAAYETGDIETAVAAYESAREIDAHSATALRELGRLYREKFKTSHNRDELNLALARFEELLSVQPSDYEAREAAQQLAAQRAIDDARWQEAESSDELIRDKDKQKDLEDSERMIRTEDDVDREITRMQTQIANEPNRARHHVRLGELLLQKHRFKSAEQSFKKAYELDKTNTTIRAKLGDVKIRFLEVKVEHLEDKLQTQGDDPEISRQIDGWRKKLGDFMVKEYHKRIREQPTNMDFHHVLGDLLYARGEYDQSMQMFQKSVADPRYRLSANHMLGRCLVAKEMHDRAINMFQRAVDGVVVMNQQVKNVYYDMGETYEKMEDWKSAEQAYGKIYDTDVGFRDIAQKMDTVYKKAREEK